MNIFGFQKMTMLDFPGRVAATVFTGGCNFRCPFCHNSDLVTHIDPAERLSEDEILEYLSKRRGILDGVCITGGEPMLNVDIGLFIGRVKELGLKVKLDTNGTFPERLRKITETGLVDYVAMDIKNSKEKYGITAGIGEDFLPQICESIEVLMNGRTEYEFRTTVVKEFHEKEDFVKIGEWLRGAEKYFLQNFTDSGKLIADREMHAHDKNFVYEAQETMRKFVKNVEIRGID